MIHSIRRVCNVKSGVRNITFDSKKVKCISLDVTGTLLVHSQCVERTYADCISWAGIPDVPAPLELSPPFKAAFKNASQRYPCYGHHNHMSSRDWWSCMAADFVTRANIAMSPAEFDRFFTRLYQHFGCQRGYEVLPDAAALLRWVSEEASAGRKKYYMGIITNTDFRTIDSILPVMGIHDHFDWFVCSRGVGVEKPGLPIFEEAHRRAQLVHPGIRRDEILHIGDNLVTDFYGAQAAGFQALFLGKEEKREKELSYVIIC